MMTTTFFMNTSGMCSGMMKGMCMSMGMRTEIMWTGSHKSHFWQLIPTAGESGSITGTCGMTRCGGWQPEAA